MTTPDSDFWKDKWAEATKEVEYLRTALIAESMRGYSKKLGWGLSGDQEECWSMLDSAVDELVGARAKIATMSEALDACETYFDKRSDVGDGDYGIPEPNEEMRMLDQVRQARA